MTRPGTIPIGYGSDALSNPAPGLVVWSSPDGKSFKLQMDDGTITNFPAPSSDTHGAAVANTLVSTVAGGLTLDRLHVGTSTGAGNGQLASQGDVFPFSSSGALGQGLAARFAGSISSLVPNDRHFRTGSIPTGYAWAGSPFGTPSSIQWSASSDYLVASSTTNIRAFLYAAFGSNRTFLVRVMSGAETYCGVRLDDGTDNNYVEARFKNNTHTTYAAQVVQNVRTGGGSVVQTIYPWSQQPTVLGFQVTGSPGAYNTNFTMASGIEYIAGTTETYPINAAITWTPTRAGLVLADIAYSYGPVDWFYVA